MCLLIYYLLLESTFGKGHATALPVRKPQPMGHVLCEESRCEVCRKIVAFLIFADNATDDGVFEDIAALCIRTTWRIMCQPILSAHNSARVQWHIVQPKFFKYGHNAHA